MARHRGLFKKVRGHWVAYRGNPFKKHIAVGHYDRHGKFHRRKNVEFLPLGPTKHMSKGRHPLRASRDYDPSRLKDHSAGSEWYRYTHGGGKGRRRKKRTGRARAAHRRSARRTTRRTTRRKRSRR